MRAPIPAAFILLVGAMLTGGASAQQTPLAAVQACAAIPDNTARLTCYDKAAAGLKQAPPAPSPSARTPAPATAPSAPPSIASVVPTDTPDRITLAVTAIDTGADGKMRFTLSNGETWRQTDTVQLKNLGKGPWTAELRKAALGSFLLQIGSKAAVRVRRVD